jgi:hypothetical protein
MTTRISKSFGHLFENGKYSTDEVSDPAELRKYYADFFKEEYFVKTQITTTKTVEILDDKYTVYVIKVNLPFTEYVIEKRYNQFLELYKRVERNYKNIGLGRTAFPSKKFFGSFNESTIQQRKIQLDGFLNFLSDFYKQEQIVEFLEYLEIKKRIEMISRLPTIGSVGIVKQDGDKPSTDIEQVTYYLILFNRNKKDVCRSFKEFENFFFETKPKFSKYAVSKLFYGDQELQGLIHLCGKYDSQTDSHLTCGAGLHLLIRLLDYEYNRDAELFNQIFGSTSLRDIMCLYFDRHIQVRGFRPCKVAAMKLLNNFINHNPNVAINQILTDDEVIQEFETWKASQQTTSIKAESYFKF